MAGREAERSRPLQLANTVLACPNVTRQMHRWSCEIRCDSYAGRLTNKMTNRKSLNSSHSIKVLRFGGTRSLINQAAGSPVARVTKPRMRKVHAVPTRFIRLSRTKLMIAPPSPPLAKTMPFASPLFRLKYCAGTLPTTMKLRDTPIPLQCRCHRQLRSHSRIEETAILSLVDEL